MGGSSRWGYFVGAGFVSCGLMGSRVFTAMTQMFPRQRYSPLHLGLQCSTMGDGFGLAPAVDAMRSKAGINKARVVIASDRTAELVLTSLEPCAGVGYRARPYGTGARSVCAGTRLHSSQPLTLLPA
jgi:hypothetical protein